MTHIDECQMEHISDFINSVALRPEEMNSLITMMIIATDDDNNQKLEITDISHIGQTMLEKLVITKLVFNGIKESLNL